MSSTSLCAVILAGGRGSRLGGRDKGLLGLDGETLAGRLVQQLRGQADEILINANRNASRYRVWAPVVSDLDPHYRGPLAGMQAALHHSAAEWICTLPCDTPAIPEDYVARLLKAAASSTLVLAHDGQSLQPVHALIHSSLRDSLDDYLAGGGNKVRAWAQQAGYTIADFSDQADRFRNANTPQDIHAMRLK
ncbi:molybdenum cofactor guanylyltransferase MobA [Granulosicoccaceae sp. 1_MG-2023]|nr:molybdenum cofactor guanylyltransferase MobA [Granulosicoccaceae sp. 1_MG-2023]